jgi:regulation of enolase protein 1 (concanavalin A-like superfamily)
MSAPCGTSSDTTTYAVHRATTNSESGFIPTDLTPPLKQSPPAEEDQIYLRFERQGHCIREAISRDGKTWISNISWEDSQGLRNKFKLGLAAYSTSTEPFKVRFDQFKLTQGQKKSK